jgi:hypothetical protein
MRVVAIVPLALALLLWSIATIVIDLRASEFRDVALRFENGATAPASYFPQALAEIKAGPGFTACSRDTVRSAATISLAGLDTTVATADASAANAALTNARETLTSALQCFPRDGNLWLRLAMVEFVATDSIPTAARMVRLSAEAAPLEGWILKQRLAFTARLAEIDRSTVADVLAADIGRFARHARVPEVVAMFGKVDKTSRDLFLARFSELSAERRNEIVTGINAR